MDFDWTGREGEARYPATMNKDIKWHEDATLLGLITHEHDLDKFEDEVDRE